MKKMIFATLMISLFAYASILAQPFNGRGNKGEKCKAELNLDDSQEKQFNDFRFDHQAKIIDLKAEIKKNRLKMKKMMVDNSVNADKLRELTKTNSGLKENIQSSRLDMWLNIYNILKKDQLEVWTKHFARMGEGNNHRNKMSKRFQGRKFEGKRFRWSE